MEQFNYTHLLAQVKQRVQLAQQRAVYAANGEMLRMYWDIGHLLSEAQKQIGWGNGALQRLSSDMRNDYLEIKGFSVRNCQCMIQFYNEYNQELTLPKDASPITQSPIAQLERTNTQSSIAQLPKYNFTLPVLLLPWGHNVILIQRVKDVKARYWYMVQSITNHFYCSAVDDVLCREGDNKTIGLLLCRTKDKIKAEYALRDINKPIGVSDYELGNMLPKDLRSSLPSIEDIERDLSEPTEDESIK